MADNNLHMQEAELTPNRLNSSRSTLHHIIIKMSKDNFQNT